MPILSPASSDQIYAAFTTKTLRRKESLRRFLDCSLAQESFAILRGFVVAFDFSALSNLSGAIPEPGFRWRFPAGCAASPSFRGPRKQRRSSLRESPWPNYGSREDR